MTKLGKAPLLKEQTITITTMRKSIARQLRRDAYTTKAGLNRLTPLGWSDIDAARGGGTGRAVLMQPEKGDVLWFLDISCKLTEVDDAGQMIWVPTRKVLDQIFIT